MSEYKLISHFSFGTLSDKRVHNELFSAVCPVFILVIIDCCTKSLFNIIINWALFSLCAPGKDAVRLDAFLEQRIPNTCSTREGQSCIFPFTYKGILS